VGRGVRQRAFRLCSAGHARGAEERQKRRRHDFRERGLPDRRLGGVERGRDLGSARETLSDAQIKQVRDHERRTKNRKSLMEQFDRKLRVVF
jgi:hypothetical protein